MTTALYRALQKLGYGLDFNESKPSIIPSTGYRVSTRGSGKNEKFVIDVKDGIELVPLDVRPDEEAMLIMIRDTTAIKGEQTLAKMLLGHDERQLFVAAAPRDAKSVLEAKERLKPGAVIAAERREGVKAKKKHLHHNEARIRQGDFFFVPTDHEVDETLLKKNQPLRRGRGNAHMLEEVVELGGQDGWEWGGRFITDAQYHRLKLEDRSLYRQTRQNARIYARGKVRHPEHKTIVLKGWHLVLPNTEAGQRDLLGRPVLGTLAYTD